MYEEESANAPLMSQMRENSNKFNYPRMKVIPIRIVSSICVILGILSISVQVIVYLNRPNPIANSLHPFSGPGRSNISTPFIGHGFWSGTIYLIAGSLGIAGTCKRIPFLVVNTVLISAVAILASFVATIISAWEVLGTTKGYLEKSLFAFHLLALFDSIILNILASMA